MVFVCWRRPSSADEKACINSSGTFNYDPKYRGATVNLPSSVQQYSENGFALNHARFLIGSGLQTYEAGKKALQTWRHFGLKWAFVDSKTRIRTGEKFCVCTKQFVPWFLMPLQIVYVNEKNLSSSSNIPPSNINASFGFGSGTLHGHLLRVKLWEVPFLHHFGCNQEEEALDERLVSLGVFHRLCEAGEERFSIELDKDDKVWYEVLSFSKPAHFLSYVGYPFVLYRQKQFAQQSTRAILQYVTAQQSA